MSEIVFNPSPQNSSEEDLRSQIAYFQTTLASLNQQLISLRETLQQKDQEILELRQQQVSSDQQVLLASEDWVTKEKPHTDETLTIVGSLIKLYQLLFPPGKVE